MRQSFLFATLALCASSFAAAHRFDPSGNSSPNSGLVFENPDPMRTMTSGATPERSVILIGWIPGLNGDNIGFQWMRVTTAAAGWSHPPMFALEIPSNTKTDNKQTGFLEFTPSITALRQFPSARWSILLQAGLPLGYESFERPDGTSESGGFIGLNASQCVLLLPKDSKGFALAAGPFESVLLGSELYPWNLGIRIAFGAQF